MKKNFLPLVVVIILILGAGYFYLSQNKSSSQPQTSSKNKTQTQTQSSDKKENKPGVFNSLKEALIGNRSVKCEFTDDQGRKTTMYFKNNLARGVYQGIEEMGNFLYRDNKMYVWDEKNKQGFVMPIPTPSVVKDEKKPKVSDADYIEAYEKYWNMCQITSVDNSVFTIPSDIQFQDMSNLQQMMGR